VEEVSGRVQLLVEGDALRLRLRRRHRSPESESLSGKGDAAYDNDEIVQMQVGAAAR
jgi:hypothetical protein